MGNLRSLLKKKEVIEKRFGYQVGNHVEIISDMGDYLIWEQVYKRKSVEVILKSTLMHFGIVWVDIRKWYQKRNSIGFDILETWTLAKPKFSNPEYTQYEELEILKKWAKRGGLWLVGIGIEDSGWERLE